MDIRHRQFLEIERRSVLGLICIYNRLPEASASNDTVKDFQRNLQLVSKDKLYMDAQIGKLRFLHDIVFLSSIEVMYSVLRS